MGLLLAGTGHAFYETGTTHIVATGEEEDHFYEASRDPNSQFLVPRDVRDTWWFMTMNESTLWMEDEDAEYFVSRETSFGFPTPKLGAKTRPC